MHSRPFHYWAWLDYCATTFRAFADAGRGDYQFRFVVNEALATRALAPREPIPAIASQRGQGLPREVVVPVGQECIREHFKRANAAILAALHEGTAPPLAEESYAALIAETLGGFRPDVVITRTPAAFLRHVFPDALVLGTELGPFSRRPYPLTMFQDAMGLWSRSLPAVCAEELMSRTPSGDDRALLTHLRAHYASYFDRASPFASLEARLRRRHKRLALLPLQFGGESGFDLNGPFRNQGEYLLAVLERLPADVGVIVTEHPTALWLGDRIDEETRAFVAERFPNATFVDHRAADAVGQMLVRHVDYVVCLSSSLGMQALFWKKPLVRVGGSHLAPYATFENVASVDPALDPRDAPDHDGALSWLFRHYYTPASLALSDPAWLDSTWKTLRTRRERGLTGLALHDESAPPAKLASLLAAPLPPPPRVLDPGLLSNGDFSSWPRGVGPFTASGSFADAWEVVHAGSGMALGRAAIEPGEGAGQHGALLPFARHCVRIARAPGGVPTLVLQRVAGVEHLAGAFATLSFWARSGSHASLHVYFYQQLDDPRSACVGTPAEVFTLTSEWRRYTYTTTAPELGDEPRGPRNHTEIVFAIPAEAGAAEVELASVELTPGGID